MAASIKTILIGVFVLIAIAIIIFILLFLHPSVGDNGKTLRVRFTDIDKVNVGTRVTFAGRPVGEVVEIHEIPDARLNRVDQHGDVYVYELVLQVDSGIDVYNTDSIVLRTSGLLGERNIEINPTPLQPGRELERVEDRVIYADQAASVEDTMKQIGDLSKKIEIVLDDFHEAMNELKQQKVIEKLAHSAQSMVEISDVLNQPQKWNKIVDNILTLSEKVNHSWTTVDASLQNIYSLTNHVHHNWAKIDQIVDNFHQMSHRANDTCANFDRALQGFQSTAASAYAFAEKANKIIDYTYQGKGTIGQLFMGDDLYLRFKSILHKGEVAMNDVNTFGLLFHLNKRWQRLQARRLRLLEKLSSPYEFSHYFNEQIDQISASLSRVSMLLNESDCYPQSLIYQPGFTKRFSELLKGVENMEESLKMYNEQVIDQEG